MKTKTPTKQHLLKLTHRMERIQRSQPLYPLSGTGVRGYSKHLAWKHEYLKNIRMEYELVQAGYLEIVQTGEDAELRLTKEGVVMSLIERLANSTTFLPEGEQCLVIFDIPEDVRRLRDRFRRILKKIQFEQLQLSAWVSNNDIVQDLNDLVTELGIEKWVKIRRIRS